jgi:glycosidase
MNKIIALILLPVFSLAQSKLKLDRMVIYEVNTRQFSQSGTFLEVEKQIPRLKAMGNDVLWIMPFYPIGKEKRKGSLGSYYSISDYKKTNPEFGSLQDFQQLVNTAHKNGLKVIIDWVGNHTAWDHSWVKNHPEYYALDSNGQMYCPYDWTDVVKLDYNNQALRQEMKEAMKFWVVDCKIDGFRCDVSFLVPNDFWISARKELDQIKPLIWLAEADNEESFEAFDILYGWEWMHKTKAYVDGKTDVNGLDSVLKKYYQWRKKGKYFMMFTSNHDENTWNGTEFEKYGNKAYGLMKLNAQFPGVLCIYNGQEEPIQHRLKFFDKDEIGFKNYKDAALLKTIIMNRKKKPLLKPAKGSFKKSILFYFP